MPDRPSGNLPPHAVSALVGPGAHDIESLDWEHLLPAARALGLIGRLAELLEGSIDQVPGKAREHLIAARRIARKHRIALAWEIGQVVAALQPLGEPILLLKGAAYLAQGLPPARGRFASDIDVMVPRAGLGSAERLLRSAGWATIQHDTYDQHYFREWMHEVPPLRHTLRSSTLDLHHTIVAPTSRYSRRLRPEMLFEAALPAHSEGVSTLSPEDMVLHSATHRFTEGEHPRALRDLIDIHDLLEHFSANDPGFWSSLATRAEQLGLGRPLYYALRYCRLLLGTSVPETVEDQLAGCGPALPIRELMDWSVRRTFLRGSESGPALAEWLLYVRGHYLRMPWRLLIPHLLQKSARRTAAVGAVPR